MFTYSSIGLYDSTFGLAAATMVSNLVMRLALAAVCVAAAAAKVVVLGPENFDQVVNGKSNVLVEFYAPCKQKEKDIRSQYGSETFIACRASLFGSDIRVWPLQDSGAAL